MENDKTSKMEDIELEIQLRELIIEYHEKNIKNLNDLYQLKTEFNRLFNKYEKTINRYIEAEQFILELNWFERLFCRRKILNFLNSRKKYNF